MHRTIGILTYSLTKIDAMRSPAASDASIHIIKKDGSNRYDANVTDKTSPATIMQAKRNRDGKTTVKNITALLQIVDILYPHPQCPLSYESKRRNPPL